MAKPSQQQAQASLARIEANLRARLGKLNLTPDQERKSWSDFYSRPQVRQLRALAGRPEVRTRQEAIQDTARRVVRSGQNSGTTDFSTALRAGLRRAMFGVPERIAAAGLAYLPSSITGNTSDASYSDILDLVRAKTDEEMGLSTSGNILGQIMGSVASGAGVARMAQGTGRALSAVAPRAGQFVQAVGGLQQGQRVRNAARIAAAGGAGGAAQAAGEGSDVGRGAAYGAAFAPVAVAGIKGAEWLTRPARDFLRATSAPAILRRITTSTADEIAERAARFRQQTGAEPSVFELLPLEDRQAIKQSLGRMPGTSRERAAGLVRERTANMGRELSARASQLTEGQQRRVATELARDLARSRGADAPEPGELLLARRATNDPTELENLRATESRNIMAPHDENVAFGSVEEMFPTSPRAGDDGTIIFEDADPEVSAAIRSAAGTLRLSENGVTIRDVSDIISDLKGDLKNGGIAGRTAQRAINHLEDTLARDHPEAWAAMQRMNEAYAGKSRMLEGMREGARTRTRAEVPVTSRKDAIKVRQAYDTPEGVRGRAMGQTARITGDFEGTPGAAVRAGQDIATSPGTRAALEGNIGEQPTRDLIEAAGAQTESARRLASLLPEQGAESGKGLDTEELVQSLAGLHPSAFLFTKFRTLAMLTRFFKGIPEDRANSIVDAMFSQDPRRTQAALDMLNSAGNTGQEFLRQMRTALITGQLAGSAGQAAGEVSTDPAATENQGDMSPPASEAPAEDGPWNDFPEEGAAPAEDGPWNDFSYEGAPRGQSILLSVYPDAEVTQALRDPDSDLGRANPGSYHNTTDGAVDVRPIPGMSFEEFIAGLEAAGHEIIEAKDEVNHPSRHATGPHWHVVFA